MVIQETIECDTSGHGEMRDLTPELREFVSRSGISCGLVNIFNVGSTGAIGVIEFEPGLQRDLPELLNRLIPPSLDYGHEQAWHDGNGHSHLQATMMGPSLTVPISDGRAILGTWQQVFLIDCDVKSRRRRIVMTAYGE